MHKQQEELAREKAKNFEKLAALKGAISSRKPIRSRTVTIRVEKAILNQPSAAAIAQWKRRNHSFFFLSVYCKME